MRGVRHLSLPWPEANGKSVSALWLRDNCPCEACRVVATDEHRVVISQVRTEYAVATIDGNDLVVDWGDHTSRYSAEWFRGTVATSRRDRPTPEPWTNSTFDLPRFEHTDMDDPEIVADCFEAFARTGVVMIHGVPTTPGHLEQFIQRWAPPHEVALGRVHDVLVDPAGYNIAHTAEPLPPHNDMASYATPPSGQIIHMLVNDAAGGDSIVVDGFAVAEQLAEADLHVLSTVRASFRQFSDRAETWTRAPLIRRAADGTMEHLRFSNQLLQPMDPFDSNTECFYESYQRLCDRVLDPSNRAQFRMDAGDLMLLHGHRVLHGRTMFDPSTGGRHLQDIYFEFEDLVNEAFRLRQRT